jgi:hypothetical protein
MIASASAASAGAAVAMMQISDESEHWRRLAEEARSEAAQITNPRAKQMLLNVADTYDAMARRAEKKLPGSDPSG